VYGVIGGVGGRKVQHGGRMLARHGPRAIRIGGNTPDRGGGERSVFVCPFYFMNISELKPLLDQDLKKSLVSPDTLLHSFLLLTEDSRKSMAYTDPKYIPFYYYLGKHIAPVSFVEVGFRLGLCSGCFFRSCKTVKNFLAFQRQSAEYYSPRLALKNIKKNYRGTVDVVVGDIMGKEFLGKYTGRTWDLALMNDEMGYDEHRVAFDTLWNGLALGGFVVADFVDTHKPGGTAFRDFCRTKNREPVFFPTRYGMGMVQK
jgi:hypothetical protein